jgi:hypothetical protein
VNDPLSILSSRKELDSTRFGYLLEENRKLYGIDSVFPEDSDGWVDEKNMALWIPIADGNRRDGVGDLLEVQGIVSERHRKNPVVLFDHGKQVTLPIAMACERNDDGQYDRTKYTFQIDANERNARLNAYFYQGKGMTGVERGKEYDHALFTEQLYDMVAKRMLGAGSIGYQVIKSIPLQPDYSAGTPEGVHLLKILMLEGSLVVMPANMDTVQKCLAMPTICGKPISPYLVKSLTPHAGPKKVQMGYEAKAADTSALKRVLERLRPGETKVFFGSVPVQRYKGPANDDRFAEGIRFTVNKGELVGIDEAARQLGELSPMKSLDDTETKPAEKSIKELRQKYKAAPDKVSFPSARRQRAGIDDTFRPGDTVTARIQLNEPGNINADPIARPGDRLKVISVNPTALNMVVERNGRRTTVMGSSVRKSLYGTKSLKWVRVDNNTEQAEENGKTYELYRVVGGGKYVLNVNGMRHSGGKDANKLKVVAEKLAMTGTKSLDLGEVRKKYRTGKNLRRRLKRSSPGASVICVGKKDVDAVEEMAKDKGLKATQLGTADGETRIKLIGDDASADEVAKAFGRPIGVKSMPDQVKLREGQFYVVVNGKPVHGPYADSRDAYDIRKRFGAGATIAIYEGGKLVAVSRGGDSKSLNGKHKSMDEDTELGAVETNSLDADTGSSEPWGAQVLRKFHADHSAMMKDYDELLGPLEHEGVKSHVTKHLQNIEKALGETEKMWSKHYKDLPGLEGVDAGEEPAEDDNGLVEEELEGEEKDADTMDDNANPADSAEPELPSPEEAVEGMKGDEELDQEMKSIRNKYRTKSLSSGNKGLAQAQSILRANGISAKFSGTTGGFKISFSSPNDVERAKQVLEKAGEFVVYGAGNTLAITKALKSVCPKCDGEPCKCKGKKLQAKKKSTEVPVPLDNLPDTQVPPAEFEPGAGAKLLPHHKSQVGEAAGFLKEIGAPGSQFDDEERMKSFHYHKTLDGMQQVAGDEAGTKGVKGARFGMYQNPRGEWVIYNVATDEDVDGPYSTSGQAQNVLGKWNREGHKSTPGSPEWAAEEANEPEHKGGDAFGEGDVPAENESGNAGSSDMFKTLGEASETFKRFSQEKAFGDPHREEANKMCKALEGITNAPDEEQKDDEAMSEDAIDPATEPGDMGQKAAEDDELEKMLKKLKEDNEEQDKKMKSLTRKFLSLNGTK